MKMKHLRPNQSLQLLLAAAIAYWSVFGFVCTACETGVRTHVILLGVGFCVALPVVLLGLSVRDLSIAPGPAIVLMVLLLVAVFPIVSTLKSPSGRCPLRPLGFSLQVVTAYC
jgi:hypothetical protein